MSRCREAALRRHVLEVDLLRVGLYISHSGANLVPCRVKTGADIWITANGSASASISARPQNQVRVHEPYAIAVRKVLPNPIDLSSGPDRFEGTVTERVIGVVDHHFAVR